LKSLLKWKRIQSLVIVFIKLWFWLFQLLNGSRFFDHWLGVYLGCRCGSLIFELLLSFIVFKIASAFNRSWNWFSLLLSLFLLKIQEWVFDRKLFFCWRNKTLVKVHILVKILNFLNGSLNLFILLNFSFLNGVSLDRVAQILMLINALNLIRLLFALSHEFIVVLHKEINKLLLTFTKAINWNLIHLSRCFP